MTGRRPRRLDHAQAASFLVLSLSTLWPATGASAALAAITEPSPTCALAAEGGIRRYYFEPVQAGGAHYPTNNNHRIGNRRYGFQTDQSIAAKPLPSGRYAVWLGTFDPHHPVADGRSTPGEQWHAEFFAGGVKVGRTSRTPDLADDVKAASFAMGIEEVAGNVTLLRGVHDPSNPKDRHAFSVWFAEFRCP